MWAGCEWVGLEQVLKGPQVLAALLGGSCKHAHMQHTTATLVMPCFKHPNPTPPHTLTHSTHPSLTVLLWPCRWRRGSRR